MDQNYVVDSTNEINESSASFAPMDNDESSVPIPVIASTSIPSAALAASAGFSLVFLLS